MRGLSALSPRPSDLLINIYNGHAIIIYTQYSVNGIKNQKISVPFQHKTSSIGKAFFGMSDNPHKNYLGLIVAASMVYIP